MVGLPTVTTYLQGVSQRFGFAEQGSTGDGSFERYNRITGQYEVVSASGEVISQSTTPQRDPAGEQSSGGVIQRTEDSSLLCRMFGVCRNAQGNVVLDPSGGGVYEPSRTPGNPAGTIAQRAGEATGLNDLVPRIATIALGGALIVTGLILSRASIVANISSAVKG